MINADLELVLQPRKILYTCVPSIIALPTKTFMDFKSYIWYMWVSVCMFLQVQVCFTTSNRVYHSTCYRTTERGA